MFGEAKIFIKLTFQHTRVKSSLPQFCEPIAWASVLVLLLTVLAMRQCMYVEVRPHKFGGIHLWK
jgi:hypothetical protein